MLWDWRAQFFVLTVGENHYFALNIGSSSCILSSGSYIVVHGAAWDNTLYKMFIVQSGILPLWPWMRLHTICIIIGIFWYLCSDSDSLNMKHEKTFWMLFTYEYTQYKWKNPILMRWNYTSLCWRAKTSLAQQQYVIIRSSKLHHHPHFGDIQHTLKQLTKQVWIHNGIHLMLLCTLC